MSQQAFAVTVRRALIAGGWSLMLYAATGAAQMTQTGPGPAPGQNPGQPPAPLSEGCIADPASCNLTQAAVDGILACQADPQSEACLAFHTTQTTQPPPRPEGGRLPDNCVADPTACGLSAEVLAGIEACQADATSETCKTFQAGAPRQRPLPNNCVADPGSCGLSAEELAGVQACQTDEASEACATFRASKGSPEACQTTPNSEACLQQVGHRPLPNCDTNPERCHNPGPAIYDVDTGILHVQALRLRQGSQLDRQYYGLELTLNAETGTLSVSNIEQLLNLINGGTPATDSASTSDAQ